MINITNFEFHSSHYSAALRNIHRALVAWVQMNSEDFTPYLNGISIGIFSFGIFSLLLVKRCTMKQQ